MKIEVPVSVKKLVQCAGAPIYLVGGYVRNAIAGLGKTDVDLCGPIIATALGLPRQYRVDIVNYRLGTASVRIGGDAFEYTPFRIENYAEGGAHTPSAVYFTTDLHKDAARRDFTLNSIYYDIAKDEIIDPFGGIADIERRVVRAHNPEKVFASDGLRLLRLVRIAVETGFKIDSATAITAKNRAALLKDISAERKREELSRILVADTRYGTPGAHYRGLRLLHQLGLWPYLIPEIEDCANVPQNPLYHKYDVMEHTFQTVRFAPPEVRLAALLHDIGKPYCLREFGNMHGHEKASAIMAREILGQAGLKYSNAVVDETCRLCALHMYDMAGNTRENKLKLFIAENYDIIDKLVMLIGADRQGSGTMEAAVPHRFIVLRDKMKENGTPFAISDLDIDGTAVMALGIQGSRIGEVLSELLKDCIIDPKLNNLKWLSERVERIAEADRRAKMKVSV